MIARRKRREKSTDLHRKRMRKMRKLDRDEKQQEEQH